MFAGTVWSESMLLRIAHEVEQAHVVKIAKVWTINRDFAEC
jgi:hypothetical protein